MTVLCNQLSTWLGVIFRNSRQRLGFLEPGWRSFLTWSVLTDPFHSFKRLAVVSCKVVSSNSAHSYTKVVAVLTDIDLLSGINGQRCGTTLSQRLVWPLPVVELADSRQHCILFYNFFIIFWVFDMHRFLQEADITCSFKDGWPNNSLCIV